MHKIFKPFTGTLKLFTTSALLIGCLPTASWADTPTPKPTLTFGHLTCEYLGNLQRIDTTSPRLSWQEASPKSYTQSSYRIIVASSPALLTAERGNLWDSGKVNSPRTTLISYSMGLLSPQDWKGVWIGKSVQVPKTDFAALSEARWIWFPEALRPSVSTPLGTRYFRSAVNLRGDRPIKQARFIGTADNDFTLCVNGKRAGDGTDWYEIKTLDADLPRSE